MLVGLTAAELRIGLVQFDWTFVFQIANTLILFLFLKKFLFKPVTEFMEARENEISGSYKDAEEKNKEADTIKSEYLEKISKAEEEGRTIVKEASKRAERRAEEIIKDADHEASSMREKAKLDIEREKTKAVNALKDDIAGLAILAATKVVEKDMKEEDHKDLINKFIDEVGDAKWQN
jgi:F-type H+-transporting ATPase subunit b